MTAFRLYEPETAGADGYPPAWHETIKHAVREAAGNRCIRCDHPYAKGAGQWSRCDTQCFTNDHHPFGDPHTRTRYEYEGESGEGIEIRPYVAGYYAWTYLGEDLTREETEARLDDLLALELAA